MKRALSFNVCVGLGLVYILFFGGLAQWVWCCLCTVVFGLCPLSGRPAFPPSAGSPFVSRASRRPAGLPSGGVLPGFSSLFSRWSGLLAGVYVLSLLCSAYLDGLFGAGLAGSRWEVLSF